MYRTGRRGFTLVEMAVTLAILVALAALAFDALQHATPRATFNGVSAEMQSLIHQARQQALAEGLPVAVMVFPNYPNPNGTNGRIIVVQDDTQTALSLFNTGAALNFSTYNPAVTATTPNGVLVTTLDLPRNVTVGPTTGLGQPTLPFPYNNIAVNVACSFCNGGGDNRGAIVFDYRGRTTFYNAAGAPLPGLSGGSFSIYTTQLGTSAVFSSTTFVITSPFGSIMSFQNG